MNTKSEFDTEKENKSPDLPFFSEKPISNLKKTNERSIQKPNTQSLSTMTENKPCHRRVASHNRQRSIYFPPNTGIDSIITSLKPHKNSHSRNLSDADSVVYLGPGDRDLNTSERTANTGKKGDLQLSIIETATGSILSAEKSPVLLEKRQMPCLGRAETTSFCSYCKKDVHTKLEINSCYNNTLLRAASKFIGCCSYPRWMAEYLVHKCPECSLVLGRSR